MSHTRRFLRWPDPIQTRRLRIFNAPLRNIRIPDAPVAAE
ncbi:hypothetical protein PATSB16_21090 [Pandoraea thiooxydans]|nr:hypothetical protein PATSB16_21090 [Pandoraea thiooxydans]